jgi:hypothetical protein
MSGAVRRIGGETGPVPKVKLNVDGVVEKAHPVKVALSLMDS